MTTKTAQFTPLISEIMAHYNLSDDEWDCLSSFTKQKLSTVYAKHAAAPAMYKALQIMVRAANVDEIDPLVMFASIERARHVLKLAEGKSA